MKRKELRILSNTQVGKNYYLLEIEAPQIAESAIPGQFVHLKINKNNLAYDPLLRRPFSIHDCDRKEGTIKLVYRITGRGTKLMIDFNSEDKVDLLGPLGRGFNTEFTSGNILIIGGGMGIVPLFYLTKAVMTDNNVLVLLGGNNYRDIQYFIDIFSEITVDMEIATIDGSEGYRGTVIDLWQDCENNFNPDFIYSCGPEIMLEKIQKLARDEEIAGQISMEERMGCGIGVCLSCVCETKKGNQRLCREGPVLPLDEVIFK